MNNTSTCDVLIVGAGPVGLTLAVDLARRGVSCRVIDQLAAPALGTRARGVSARTLEIFEDLDVLERLSASIEPAFPWRFYDRDGHVLREVPPPVLPPRPDIPYPTNLIIGQQHTETALRERLEGLHVQVEWQSRLVAFTQQPDYVVAEIMQAGRPTSIQARYLVGCDGGGSTVRKCAITSFQGETYAEEHVMFGNLSVSGLDESYWHFWTDPQEGLLVTLNPMPRCQTWFFTAAISPDAHGLLPPATLKTFARIFQQRVGLAHVSFFDPIYLSIYQLNIRMVNHYRNGRIFLAGDAAHVHSPAGGQGMNTGVQDAYNLGWKLAAVLGGAPDTLLETYQSERLPIAQHVLASTTARTRSWNAAESGGNAAVAQNMSNTFQGKDAFGDVTQLSVTYRGSVLARDLDDATLLRAGDRAPDATGLRGQHGEQVRLFDLLRGPSFTLLAFSDEPLPWRDDERLRHLPIYRIVRPHGTGSSDRDTLIDTNNQAWTAYGVSANALVLVRPDGYVGLTTGNLAVQPLLAYLREFTGA